MSDPATPTDILSQIFELVVAIRTASLYTIRSVNRNWFETAAITPRLWSNLTLSHFIRVHIQNPGGLPHDISISPPEELQGADIPAIPLLRQRVHKFKSLALDTPSQEAWQKIVSRLAKVSPPLSSDGSSSHIHTRLWLLHLPRPPISSTFSFQRGLCLPTLLHHSIARAPYRPLSHRYDFCRLSPHSRGNSTTEFRL